MRWTYQITAASKPDVLRELVRVFEQQSLAVQSVELALLDNRIRIRIVVEVETGAARRIEARLHGQPDVQDVDLLAS